MLMAIDVGNTNMVFGLLEGKELVGSFRLMTDANRTSDEIGLTVCEYFRRFNLSTDQVCRYHHRLRGAPGDVYAHQCHCQVFWKKAHSH